MSPARIAFAVLACCAAATAPAAASDGPLVDLALTASASAPAVNDGNAATTSCSSNPVTVDLGRPHRLEGFGVSLAGDASSARVTIEAAGRRIAATVPVGTPAWLPAHRPLVARTVRLRTSADVCVAELRALGRTSRSTIVGHDLSFAVQEAAVHATYTDRGRAAPPSGSWPTTAPTGCACACGSIRPPATATCRACSRWRAARRPPACASCSTRTTRTSGPIGLSYYPF